MKVLLLDKVHPVLAEGLKKLGFTVEEDYASPPEEILRNIASYEGLIVRSRFPVDARFLDATRLRFIGRVGAGMENIDTEAARRNKVALVNAPEGNRDAVGEHATGMLLMLLNNLKRADSEVRNGLWRREENRGYELSGKTVGIIGYGNMGSAFAEKLKGFGVKILAYDTHKTAYGSPGICESSLQDIHREADIVSFHVPQNETTLYYFDEGFSDRMQKPFYLVNTSRGKVVKTSALVKGLRSGKVLGACLDVLEYEKSSFEDMFSGKLPGDFDYLVHSEKVILSPHIAGWTHESNRKMAEVIVDKIKMLYRENRSEG